MCIMYTCGMRERLKKEAILTSFHDAVMAYKTKHEVTSLNETKLKMSKHVGLKNLYIYQLRRKLLSLKNLLHGLLQDGEICEARGSTFGAELLHYPVHS